MPDLFTSTPKAEKRPTRCPTCGGTAAMWIPVWTDLQTGEMVLNPGTYAVRDIQPEGCAYCRANPGHGRRAVAL